MTVVTAAAALAVAAADLSVCVSARVAQEATALGLPSDTAA